VPEPIRHRLELEQPIKDRLKDEVPELLDVLSIAELNMQDVEDSVRRTPAGIVFYDGHDVIAGEGGASSQGASQAVDLRWGIVLAVRNVRDPKSGDAARSEAGELMRAALDAFAGWQPPLSGYKPLREGSPPGPAYSETGMAYLPLLFLTRTFN
jgi:hypothetical protein